MKSSKEIAEVFRALGDPTRIEILRHLQSGEKTTTELSELMELSQSAVTHHITVLYMSRLLGCRREGKWVYAQGPLTITNYIGTGCIVYVFP